MNKKQCLISFHPNLSEKEVQNLMEAISLFRGVESILPQGNIKGESSFTLKESSPIQASSPPPNINSFSESNQQTLNAKDRFAENTISGAENQRKIIASIIKWGIYEKKITMDQLQQSTAEGTIELAKRLIEIMPQGEREKILKS